ncbi:hypothetical protein BDW67DRAFT_48155 [Aspergillus spinulosporus]
MTPVRRVVDAQLITDFLQYVLHHDRFSVLVICMAREAFLQQLLAAVNLHSTAPASHELMSKTLGLLSTSRNVRTVFCPTLEHLRAYLSVGLDGQLLATECREKPRPFLAILNPLALHRSTREFSAQGLSRTFASAVEVSSKANMDLLLCECRDALDPSNTGTDETVWYTDVTLLSNSLRSGTEGDYWTEQTVPVKMVVQRWFRFTESSK